MMSHGSRSFPFRYYAVKNVAA